MTDRTRSRVDRLMTTVAGTAGVVALALAPAIVKAPTPVRATPDGVRTLADAVAACRATGLEGWDLVAYAQQLVFRKFTRYSILNLWESPALAFRNSRGFCNQYNAALGRILEELGFEVERVHASRVRQDDNPWWRMGHSWLRVEVDGVSKEVCAGRASHRPGHVEFVPVSEIHPFTTFTYLNTTNGMVLFTVFQAWRSVLTGKPLPRWVYRPFGERVQEED
ncbi:arylamine N-acetyltransferase [Mariniluteicoccus flavus]